LLKESNNFVVKLGMGLDLSFNDNYWQSLETIIDRSPNFDKKLIRRAYDFMEKAHEGQKRYSGESYISHPVWIAKVVAQLNIGQEAVMAALLHDCVEDTNTTINDIASEFGRKSRLIII
jgi:GTP pyrophosphokinase